VSFLLAGHFDALELFVEFSQDHEDWELDEILVTAVSLVFVLSLLLFNRTRQLKDEIKRRKLYESEMALLASTDPLTKLSNRRDFLPKLERSISSIANSDEVHAVLFVDIDDFKQINDIHGHSVGDELLVNISKVLVEVVRKSDLVSRFAGDEFVIHLSGVQSRDEAALVAQKIIDRAAAVHEISISLSIGISFTSENNMSAESLISEADRAMYVAKERGKNGYYFMGQ
ncbi:GGDEF domain-containing protein, partial [Oleiphilus sp. HI0079]